MFGRGKRQELQENPSRAICEANTDIRAMRMGEGGLKTFESKANSIAALS